MFIDQFQSFLSNQKIIITCTCIKKLVDKKFVYNFRLYIPILDVMLFLGTNEAKKIDKESLKNKL